MRIRSTHLDRIRAPGYDDCMAGTKPIHAIDFLDTGEMPTVPPVCVVFGTESFLKRKVVARIREAVLGQGEGEFSLATFDGHNATCAEVFQELATLAMFGGSRRLVVVEQADEFVSRYRAELEHYVSHPKASGVLLLEVATWQATTRLYKAVAANGLQVECTSPPPARLTPWLIGLARKEHRARLSSGVAEQLVEMIGPDLGLLDQELAKLALSAGPDGEITPDLVCRMVGTWRAKTAWDMLDAALEGHTAEALLQFDRLMLAGEHPVAVLAQISSSLRRLAAATRLVLAAEACGQRISLRTALEQAGVKGFFLAKAERQLRRLGRHRGQRLYKWLLETDLGLKGDSQADPRQLLERLLVRLSLAPSPAIPRV